MNSKDGMRESIKERFKVVLKNNEITQQELSALSGVSVRTISRISAEGVISAKTAEKIAPYLGVSELYLRARSNTPTTSSAPITSDPTTEKEPPLSVGEEPVWIPVVEPHVCAGGGNGYMEIDWEPVGRFPFAPADLLGVSWHSGTLRIIRVDGNSMEPRYRDGDMILFSEECVSSGDVIVALWDSRLFLRGYIEDKKNETCRLKALNPDYADIVIDPDDERFLPLGKVVGKVNRIEPDRGFW